MVDLDERRHEPGPEPGWEESWTFDLVADAVAGFLRLALRAGGATFEAALVGDGRPLVLVLDTDLAPPRTAALELRAEGLWTALECEEPLEHWTVGLEAFGVALDDPEEALRGCRGDRVALGLDVEWETAGAPVIDGGGYGLPCRAHGDVLVGRETLAVDGTGWRRHDRGVPSWPERLTGHLDDGTPWSGPADGVDVLAAVVLPGPVVREWCRFPGGRGWRVRSRR